MIAEQVALSRRQVGAVFDALNGIVTKSLKQYGVVTLPGLAKMKHVKKPATWARAVAGPRPRSCQTPGRAASYRSVPK